MLAPRCWGEWWWACHVGNGERLLKLKLPRHHPTARREPRRRAGVFLAALLAELGNSPHVPEQEVGRVTCGAPVNATPHGSTTEQPDVKSAAYAEQGASLQDKRYNTASPAWGCGCSSCAAGTCVSRPPTLAAAQGRAHSAPKPLSSTCWASFPRGRRLGVGLLWLREARSPTANSDSSPSVPNCRHRLSQGGKQGHLWAGGGGGGGCPDSVPGRTLRPPLGSAGKSGWWTSENCHTQWRRSERQPHSPREPSHSAPPAPRSPNGARPTPSCCNRCFDGSPWALTRPLITKCETTLSTSL